MVQWWDTSHKWVMRLGGDWSQSAFRNTGVHCLLGVEGNIVIREYRAGCCVSCDHFGALRIRTGQALVEKVSRGTASFLGVLGVQAAVPEWFLPRTPSSRPPTSSFTHLHPVYLCLHGPDLSIWPCLRIHRGPHLFFPVLGFFSQHDLVSLREGRQCKSCRTKGFLSGASVSMAHCAWGVLCLGVLCLEWAQAHRQCDGLGRPLPS